jgi:hypothetical protein
MVFIQALYIKFLARLHWDHHVCHDVLNDQVADLKRNGGQITVKHACDFQNSQRALDERFCSRHLSWIRQSP